MAAENIAAQQDDIGGEHDSSQPDSETPVEPERLPHVVDQKPPDYVREAEEVAVKILQDQRPGPLPEIGLARLRDRAGGWIRPERCVVGAAIVIAGQAKEARYP